MIYPIVLAGGVGSRLWPLSRSKHPKQCLDVTGSGESLLQSTLNRAAQIKDSASAVVVCNEDHRFLVAEQGRTSKMKVSSILLEPAGRNTAPAIAVAAWQVFKQDPAGVLLVLASDHNISDEKVFVEKIDQGYARAQLGNMITFGIEPHYPETGYGYIKAGGRSDVEPVVSFVEKPDLDTATSYLESGQYLWNSGMFMFRADAFLEELGRLEPEILSLSEKAINDAQTDLDFLRLASDWFKNMPSISVDYAVMERTQKAEVVRLPNIWSDVGSWGAIWDINEKNTEGNVLQGDVIAHDTHDCYVRSESRLVTTIGLKDLIIVDTHDALLVADKTKAQDVKKIVEYLSEHARSEIEVHAEVFRPWGKYQTVDIGGRYQVKRITVSPNQRLSTQLHHHRSEHWIVVKGTAKVRKGDQISLVTENESTYIPVGEIHSLENPGLMPLELIEVQTGGYLGEDDIVRLDDRYGRAPEENENG